MHIAIFRSDNIGDLLLTLPLIYGLKTSLKNVKLTLIAREYVREIAEAASSIDSFLALEVIKGMKDQDAIQGLQKQNFDSLIMLKDDLKLRNLCREAGIPHIIYKIKNYFYFSRYPSLLKSRIMNINFYNEERQPIHYAQRLLKFCSFYGKDFQIPREKLYSTMQLSVRHSEFVDQLLEIGGRKVVLHLGTNGHTDEWPAASFAMVAEGLPDDVTIFLTGSLEEGERFLPYFSRRRNIVALFGQLTLRNLSYLLSRVDCLVANGTGPLHLAAALGTRVIGIYPARSTVNNTRWGPLGKNVSVLSAPPCKLSVKNRKCRCIEKISADSVLTSLLQYLNEPKLS